MRFFWLIKVIVIVTKTTHIIKYCGNENADLKDFEPRK